MIACRPVFVCFHWQMDSCHTLGHIKVVEGGLLSEGTPWSHSVLSVVADCPPRPSLAEQWWLTPSERCMETLDRRPHGGWPCQRVCLGKKRGLERAGDTLGTENLSSGAFSPDPMSTLHARVYIASGNKLWGNLILSEAACWLSSHLRSPVAGHQVMVPPLLRVCIT